MIDMRMSSNKPRPVDSRLYNILSHTRLCKYTSSTAFGSTLGHGWRLRHDIFDKVLARDYMWVKFGVQFGSEDVIVVSVWPPV